MRSSREQIALRRGGTITVDEAMQAVADDKMVTRPTRSILRALLDGDEDPDYHATFFYRGRTVLKWKLDNLDGGPSGSGDLYEPTDDDRVATDLMEYHRPDEVWFDPFD